MNKDELATVVAINNEIEHIVLDAMEYSSNHHKNDNFITGYIAGLKKIQRMLNKMLFSYHHDN